MYESKRSLQNRTIILNFLCACVYMGLEYYFSVYVCICVITSPNILRFARVWGHEKKRAQMDSNRRKEPLNFDSMVFVLQFECVLYIYWVTSHMTHSQQ